MKERLAGCSPRRRAAPAAEKPLYFMLGNDDPIELKEAARQRAVGSARGGKVLWLDDDHEMISWGY